MGVFGGISYRLWDSCCRQVYAVPSDSEAFASALPCGYCIVSEPEHAMRDHHDTTDTKDSVEGGDMAQATAAKQTRLQAEQDCRDRTEPASKSDSKPPWPDTGRSHSEPQPPMPAQHLRKPGKESEMEFKPHYLAPHYRGSGKLEGYTSLITGGDSGIGRSVAVLFAREGADVAIVYLNEHEDAQFTQRLVEKEGRRCLLLPGDVKSAAFCKSAVDKTVAEFNKLDVLVNNAAFQEHADSLEDLSEERFDETLRTNVYGYFHMARAAVPHLRTGASIINTGSVTGLSGSKNLLDYSATKGAIHAFTKALASNLIPKGIRVNAVAPGPVWTPLNPGDQPADKIVKFGQATDVGRAAQPEELAPAYVFLAAPCCSSYITGIVLPVTGSVGG